MSEYVSKTYRTDRQTDTNRYKYRKNTRERAVALQLLKYIVITVNLVDICIVSRILDLYFIV